MSALHRGLGELTSPRAAHRASRKCSTRSGMSSPALAQRRKVDREDGEAVVEVLAEAPRASIASWRSRLRRGDDADVDRDLVACRRRAATDALLEDAQELDLHLEPACSPISSRKRVPPSASLERARASGDGAGEGALLVAEQLDLEQVARDRPAIDGDIGSRRTVALRVDGAGDHFLAASRRSGDDHRGRARRHLPEQIAHLDHRAAEANDQTFCGNLRKRSARH